MEVVKTLGEMVEFPSNGHTCGGYLATPRSGRGAGVVVIQEWWGLVDHIKNVCDRLAGEGFVALAPDLFHGDSAGTHEPDKAGKLAQSLKLDEAGRDLAGAVHWLTQSGRIAGDRVGVVGFCLGGALALFAASNNPEIAATVAFYPALGYPPGKATEPERIQGAVLGHYATEDGSYTRDEVQELEQRLRESGVDVEFFWYENTDHAFFNDTRPEAHHPDAAQLAWDRTVAFFRRHLVTTATPVG